MTLKEAIEIFGLDDKISINLVKRKFREFQKMYHPDVSNNYDSEHFNRINKAYKFLIHYLENFQIDIEQLFQNISDEEKLKKRFSNDWLSGKNL